MRISAGFHADHSGSLAKKCGLFMPLSKLINVGHDQ
jgi:hypothetical protein